MTTIPLRATYLTQVPTDLPDNSSGSINPALHRKQHVDAADSTVWRSGDTLLGGFSQAEYDAGTKTTGIFTPVPASGNLQKATNNGAHSLGAPATDTEMRIRYINGASAGAISLSGFTLPLRGATLTTTVGHEFFIYISKGGSRAIATAVALQ